MKIKRHCLAALTLLGIILGQAAARADEGMWLIQDINSALEKKMQDRGLKLSAGEIYNADAQGSTVSDAIVSLGFYCTGSIISDQGLLITNHHCAYSDVFALSITIWKRDIGQSAATRSCLYLTSRCSS